jgi:hypothetical protein
MASVKEEVMRRPRKPRWYEMNLINKEGLEHPEEWMVLNSNLERLRLWNRKNGKIREIWRDDRCIEKQVPVDASVDEYVARGMRERHRCIDGGVTDGSRSEER